MVIVILFSTIPLQKVSAAGEIFMPTTVKCRIGGYDMRLNIYGSYQGQWATVRHLIWNKLPGKTSWTYIGATPWKSIQLFGTPLNTLGGWGAVNNIQRNTLISIRTEVIFSYPNGSKSPVYAQVANHYDYLYNTVGTFCMVY